MKAKTNLTFKEGRHEVFANGVEVRLSRKEYDILMILRDRNITVSRESLFKEVWGPSGDDYDIRTVDQHICRLRNKIGACFISTVSGRGYKFVGA